MIIINKIVANGLNEAQRSHKMILHWSAKIDRLNEVFHAETYPIKTLLNLVTEKFSNFQVLEYTYPARDNKDKKLPKK